MNLSPLLTWILCFVLLLCAPSAIAQQWVATYNGPDSLFDSTWGAGDDIPSGMVVDAAGNAYVTGASGFDYRRGVPAPRAFAVTKYDVNGTSEWVHRIEGLNYKCSRCGFYPAAIGAPVLDDAGNVYLAAKDGAATGEYSLEGGEYFIQKISPDGNLLLDIFYDGVDLSGKAPSLALDAAGNIYIAGSELVGPDSVSLYHKSILILKFDPAGTMLWEQRLIDSGEAWCQTAFDVYMQVDSAGNAYLTSVQCDDSLYSTDIFTMKYDTDGNLLWLERYDHPWAPADHGSEEAYGIRLDTSGDIYVTGRSTAPWNCSDCTVPSGPLLLKYDTDGNLLWDLDSNVFVSAIELDGDGNIVLAGRDEVWCGGGGLKTSQESTAIGDYHLQKLDPNGVLLWEQSYDNGDSLYDEAAALEVDASGNIFVTGRARGLGLECLNPSAESDYGTIMLDPNGNVLWSRTFAGPAPDGTDGGVDVKVDVAGDVYVTGYCWDDSTSNDFGTLKYHPCSVPLGLFGDMNEDGVLTSADVIYLVGYVFKGGAAPPVCEIFGDTNNDGPVTSADIIYMVNHIFKGGPAPAGDDPCSHPLAGTCP